MTATKHSLCISQCCTNPLPSLILSSLLLTLTIKKSQFYWKKSVLLQGKPRDATWFSKMVAGRHPGFDRTRNSAIRYANPENHTLEPNMKWVGSPIAEIWPFEIRHIMRGCILDPHFEGNGGRRGSSIVPLESDGGFLYAPHCDHCTISNHLAAICHGMSVMPNSTGGGSLFIRILGCPLWSRSVTLGSAESKHPRLTNREIRERTVH